MGVRDDKWKSNKISGEAIIFKINVRRGLDPTKLKMYLFGGLMEYFLGGKWGRVSPTLISAYGEI